MSKKLFYYGSTASFSNLYSWLGDGVDEYMISNIANYRSGDLLGSLAGWIKTTTATAQVIFSSCDTAVNDKYIQLGLNSGFIRIITDISGSSDIVNSTTTTVNTGAWVHVAWTSSGTAWKMYVNGIAQTLSVAAGTNSGEWFGDVSGRDNIAFGRLVRLTPAVHFPADLQTSGYIMQN